MGESKHAPGPWKLEYQLAAAPVVGGLVALPSDWLAVEAEG